MVGNEFSGNRQPKDHGLLLFLPPELVLALARLQASCDLGRSYAGLRAINRGFFELGVLSEGEYAKLELKYSKKLIVEAEPEPPSKTELAEQKRLEGLEKHYSEVLKLWPSLNLKAKTVHLQKAKEVSDRVHSAKLVLDLGGAES